MHLPFTKINIPLKDALANIIIVVNAFVWYTYASSILRGAIDEVNFTYFEKMIFYIVLFLGTVIFILAGASLADKLINKRRFLLIWNLLGVFSSLAIVTLATATIVNFLFISILIGASFGLGLSICLANFADITKEENRAQFGSILIFSMFLGVLAFRFVLPESLLCSAIVLAAWRLLGLVGIRLSENFLDNKGQKRSPSLFSLFNDRSILLYLIPWTMFSMINYLGWPISSKIHGEDFVYSSVFVNNVIAGIFALSAGFLADNIGRKRTLIGGFIIFGIGYAVLGINHFSIYAWYFYTVVDGIAWGIFYVIFWFTIWGDLAHGKSSEKYYAVGIIPYSLSGFLRVTLGPFLINVVSEYAIFSFAAFFLFLAVVPLMFAPETLPEKSLRERELRQYIEKAKKIREKFT